MKITFHRVTLQDRNTHPITTAHQLHVPTTAQLVNPLGTVAPHHRAQPGTHTQQGTLGDPLTDLLVSSTHRSTIHPAQTTAWHTCPMWVPRAPAASHSWPLALSSQQQPPRPQATTQLL